MKRGNIKQEKQQKNISPIIFRSAIDFILYGLKLFSTVLHKKMAMVYCFL